MLNFDANWYRYLYDEEMRKGYEADRAATEANQVRDEYIDTDIWKHLWTEDEKVNFASTPMFRIAAMR